MRFELTSEGFKKDGKPFFLISGEMHYFRVRKKDWPKHLEKMKRAKLDALTTYIPWSWHESKPGEFDLEGRTKPERDIIGFIDLCKEMDLDVVVKPGPYILAEYQDQGIPKWLIAKHPEIQVQGPQGNFNIPFVCSFMHPTFLEYAGKWFDQIIPAIRGRQFTKGGPILMMQLCNEVGLQQWLAGVGDYNPATLKYYYGFLEKKHGSLSALNQLYGKNYSSFEQVIPPSGNMENSKDIARYRDWHEFHRMYYFIYLDYLTKDLRKRGIELPFYENVPGWVYGRATEFPVCITLYSEVVSQYPELLLGLDHIPENVDFRNFHDASIITEMVRSLQGRKLPIYSAEFQAGSREHCVRTYPNELELFYKSVLSYGTQGWNYYMFSQGKNPPNEGVYGPTFYWDTPLDVKGKETPLYDTAERINEWIKAHEENLVLSKKNVKLGAAFYKPYYETEFFYPLFAKDKYFRPEKAGLTFDIKGIRDAFYFEGLLKALHILNCPPELPDLQVQSVEDLLQYRLLWVLCLDLMDLKTQEKLLEFLKRGGRAIFYPGLPKYDLEGRPCEILRKGLGIENESLLFPVDSKVKFFDLEPVSSLSLIHEFYANGSEPVAKIGQKICGFEKKIGKGQATILGTIPNYQIEEHLEVLQKFLERGEIFPEVVSDNPDVLTQLRTGPKGSFLFLLNFHPIEKEVVLEVPYEGKKIRIPSNKKLKIPPTSGLILPLNWKTASGAVHIVYSTSELFKESLEEGTLKLNLRGSPGTLGELMISKSPQKVLMHGKEISAVQRDHGFLITYRHPRKEFSLEVYS